VDYYVKLLTIRSDPDISKSDITMLDAALALALVIPFPAYGSPQPQAVRTVPIPGVPTEVTLTQAISIAAAASPILASARATLHLTQLGVDQARTGELPNLSVAGTYASGNAATGAYGGAVEKSASLNLQQLVFDGGRVAAQIRSARFGAGGAGDTYARELQTLAYNVAQAYYTALQAESQVHLQLEIVDQNQSQEALIAAQIRAGTVAPIDLETAQIPTTQARVSVLRAQGAQLSALAAFAATLGLRADAAVAPIGDPRVIDESALPPHTPLDYDVAIDRALLSRPDYLAAQAQVDASGENVRANRLTHAPTLSLVASGGYQAFGTVAAPLSAVDSVGANVALPLFDQNVTNVAVAQAVAQFDQTRAALDASQLQVRADVREALVQLIAARAALEAVETELSKARDVLSATQTQYRAGQTSLALLLNAQTQLTNAETDRLTSIYDVRQSEQTYLYALGENDLESRSQP
jgi:outer membrane protein